MTNAADAAADVKSVVAKLKATLKPRGYAAKGHSFRRCTPEGNTLLVSVQKSRDPGPAKITVNYGIHSARVGRWLQEDARQAEDVSGAHWSKRINDGGEGRWIVLSPDRTVDNVAAELIPYVERAVADLEAHQSDEALRDEWLAGQSPGVTELRRMLQLVILVKEMGPRERLREVVTALRSEVEGRPQWGVVRHYLGPSWDVLE